MSLDSSHREEMDKLDELIRTAKERKSTKFMELIVASIVGVITSKLFDAVYGTPIVLSSWEDNVIRAFIFVTLLFAMTACLFVCVYSADILQTIRNRMRKKT